MFAIWHREGTTEKLRAGNYCKTNIQHRGEHLTSVSVQSSLAWGCSSGCTRMEHTGSANLEKRGGKKKDKISALYLTSSRQYACAWFAWSQVKIPTNLERRRALPLGAGLQTQAARGARKAVGNDGKRGKVQPAAQGTGGGRARDEEGSGEAPSA